MANTQEDRRVTLNDEERETLRAIVNDWVREELVFPPYSKEIRGVLARLGINFAEDRSEPGRTPLPLPNPG